MCFPRFYQREYFRDYFLVNGFSKKFYDTLIQEYHKPGALVDWKTKSYFIDERIVQ